MFMIKIYALTLAGTLPSMNNLVYACLLLAVSSCKRRRRKLRLATELSGMSSGSLPVSIVYRTVRYAKLVGMYHSLWYLMVFRVMLYGTGTLQQGSRRCCNVDVNVCNGQWAMRSR
jgi:hypothetical protein